MLVGLSACLLFACGRSPAPATSPPVAARALHARPPRPPPGTPPITCSDHKLVPANADVAREQCRAARISACKALVEEKGPPPSDLALAREILGAMCKRDRASLERQPNDVGIHRDRTCSCFAYGYTLWLEADGRFDAEALALTDESCVAGNDDACMDVELSLQLCEADQPFAKRPICEQLRKEGRIRLPNASEEHRHE